MHQVIRGRLAPAAGVLLTIGCGLGLRRGIGGDAGEHLGNVAWGVMWTLIVLTIAPQAQARARVWVVAGVAVAIVFGIEFVQLTPYPARWSAESVIARYTVGGVFEVHDLVVGAIGVLLAGISVAWSRR